MRPKLHLDELNKALLITCGVCYLLSFVLNRYAAASTLFRLLFAAAAIFLGIRLFAGNPGKREDENRKFLTALTAVKEFFHKPFQGGAQRHASTASSTPTTRRTARRAGSSTPRPRADRRPQTPPDAVP